jgi:hypothetical protein
MRYAAGATPATHVRRRRPSAPAAAERAGAAACAWFLVALWVVALAVTILRGDHSLSEEGS